MNGYDYITKIYRIIRNPYILLAKIIKGKNIGINDRLYLRIIYRATFAKKLNLSNPVTYNEKLQYLKLYDRNTEYRNLVDKYEVRSIVKEKIGEEFLVQCYGVWDSFDEIDFDVLPNKFVLKCTHDSGSVIVCKDKNIFNVEDSRIKFNKWLKKNHYWTSREWPYKAVSPRIIAEEYLEDSVNNQLLDYKFFCFFGNPKYLFIASDRHLGFKNTKFDYFDNEFNRLNLRQSVHPNSTTQINKPQNFELMLDLCEKLSKGMPHVRIDLYEVNGKVYFGEFTLYHHGGFVPFEPSKFDDIWGELIDLSRISK